MRKWQWILKQFSSKLWVRASLFCVLAILTAFLGIMLKGAIPETLPQRFGAKAVDGILEIIASSMLAVTTFSLSTMVAAYSAATSNVTPRSTQLLLQDSTAQNALSVFIGAFIFSLVSIIILSMEVYEERGRLVLFVVTLIVIVIIITVLLRWINYLSRLGRVGETIDMIENATTNALADRINNPCLGGKPLGDYKPDKTHQPLRCDKIGYVQNIDMPALSKLAQENDVELHICLLPGVFYSGVEPMLYASSELTDEAKKEAVSAFSIGDQRSFSQDPRFGFVVLSEIASRALSPAINDPGTAIDIIGTGVRTIAPWVMREKNEEEPIYPRLYVPHLKTSDLFNDLFTGVARDGAGLIEVVIRLQKAFNSLGAMGNEEGAKEAKRLAKYSYEFAQNTLTQKADKERLEAIALVQ